MKYTVPIFSLAAMVQAQDILDVSIGFDFAGMQVLDRLVNDTVLFNDILDHGCWCSKLDPTADHGMLGGSEPLDGLDNICKRWFMTRHCNDGLSGGSCTNAPLPDHYELDYTELHNPECNTVDSDDGATITDCAHDSCLIDVHYSELINDYISENVAWMSLPVADFDTCLLPDVGEYDKICTGVAPHLNTEVVEAPPAVAANTAEAEAICQEAEADVMFLVDGSGSMQTTGYADACAFIDSVVQTLTVSATNTRVSVQQWSNTWENYCASSGGYCESQASANQAVTDMTNNYMRHITNTANALYEAFQVMSNGARPGIAQTLVIITDGASNDGLSKNGVSPASFHNYPATVYVIGVGGGTNQAQLEQLASTPYEDHLYDLNNFDDLETVRLAITSSVCT